MSSASLRGPHEAMFQSVEGDRVRCGLCPHGCLLAEGRTGVCGVRRVVHGRLVSLVYGIPCSLAVDPIEKKPLFHFLPGCGALSFATVGCNLCCAFCQNHEISQPDSDDIRGRYVPPEAIVEAAVVQECAVIAHTYSEPTVFFEYALDVARLGKERGIHSVFVTNGYTSRAALDAVVPYLAAANVDLKAFRDETYRKVCGGRLQPVLDTIACLHGLGVWVEVTTLIVPGMNDSREELGDIARFLASVDPMIPWHVSRFHPDYRMTDRAWTPSATLEAAVEEGQAAGLKFLYVGNIQGTRFEDTRCPSCAAVLVERTGYRVRTMRVKEGRCPDCGAVVPGRWIRVF
jgi:pyruvate formate lyase activating enzyme